jgi:hypothetical protein
MIVELAMDNSKFEVVDLLLECGGRLVCNLVFNVLPNMLKTNFM